MEEYKVVKIEKLDHQGRGIAHDQGNIIFVANALPGEVVKLKIEKRKKNILEASVASYLEVSEDRISSPCPYYGECGGCDLMHLSYQKQLQYKENKVKEIMSRFAHLKEEKIKPIIGSDAPFYYRNKAIFQVGSKIGFFRKKTADIIAIEKCMICNQNMNDKLALLTAQKKIEAEQIMIRTSIATGKTMVESLSSGQKKGCSFIPCDSFYQRIGKKENHIAGDSFLIEQIKDKQFMISPQSFFQVNSIQVVKLYDQVKEYAELTGKETLFDLYCGAGTIGLYLSRDAKEVIGIEQNESAILNAKENAKLNHASNITFYCGDVGTEMRKLSQKADIIVVDPPRAGLDETTRQLLLSFLPTKIIYVSCDPITLARDLVELSEAYEIKEITPVDMFSQTHHVECVALLTHK